MPPTLVAGRAALDALCINTIRALAMDAVQRANSGHPGTPMALAPLCYVLWTRHLRHNPRNPAWPGRDRFVLSCGHASMLLYSLLHLSGYDLPLDELVNFRQWGSRTPGHPERGVTPGVETTTGPLGQGFGNAVGMAIAEAQLAAQFNRPGHAIVHHRTYVLMSDGDMMEGISHEAASLAGHLRLGRLIAFYDDNRITIDGPTALTMSENTAARFEAYGWHVQRVEDGNDLRALEHAIAAAQAETLRPSLIIVRTHIAYGSPNKQDTAEAHGAPLGDEEVRLTKENLGWRYSEPFTIPEEALAEWRKCLDRGAAMEAEWQRAFDAYRRAHPSLARELSRRWAGELPDGWEDALPGFDEETRPMATRAASGKVLQALAPKLPELVGGAADLGGSTNTLIKGEKAFGPDAFDGRNFYFGVREHAMGAILNGMALHGGFLPYGGTFLVFSDYMRPAIRLAAMMRLRVIYVFSHDSIGLGEDGPTHQPVEHLTALRAIPHLTVIRPADAAETAAAWRVALRHREGPVALILTRQPVPPLPHERPMLVERGGYVVREAGGNRPQLLLMASGSEVMLALEAQAVLEARKIATRVVSFPSLELFDRQPPEYRAEVLPPGVTARLAIEAAHPGPWYRLVGFEGDVLGIERFGASAPYRRIFEAYGFTVDNVVARAEALLRR